MCSKLTIDEGIKFFARITFGTACFQEYKLICIKRAYKDLSRTIHGVGKLKKEENVILRNCGELLVSEFVTIILTNKITVDEFDKCHKEVSEKLIKLYSRPTSAIQFYVGTAQKWINMTLKYLYMLYLTNLILLTEEEKANLKNNYKFFHLPIDNIVVANDEFLRCTYNNNLGRNTRWSRIDEYIKYLNFQIELRSKNVPPLDYEFNIWLNG